MYIITDYEKSKDNYGYAPILPKLGEYGGYGQLCRSGRGSHFAVFDVLGLTEEQIVPPMERVTGELAQLLEQGEKYPPAIAKARSILERHAEPMTRNEFQSMLTEELRTQLDGQRNNRYFLARCVDGDSGYKGVGSYYWIAGWRIQGEHIVVGWVSDDYFFYADLMTDFDVTEDFLRERFGEPRQPKKGFPRAIG